MLFGILILSVLILLNMFLFFFKISYCVYSCCRFWFGDKIGV